MRYIIKDNDGYTWCEEKGIFTDKDGRIRKVMRYWSNGFWDRKDFELSKKKMLYPFALLLWMMMSLARLDVYIVRLLKGCGKTFSDEDCEDQFQFWFCGKMDEEDGQIHYCKKCVKTNEGVKE